VAFVDQTLHQCSTGEPGAARHQHPHDLPPAWKRVVKISVDFYEAVIFDQPRQSGNQARAEMDMSSPAL
jgi:hypothetical protein